MNIKYSRLGNGQPMVLLHGLGASRHAWAPVVPRLVDQFDITAVDMPGFGDSPSLPWMLAPTPRALAERLITFFDDRNLENPHLVGHSLGGWIALEIAKRRPVASLTLLSPLGLWEGHAPRYSVGSLRLSRWLSRRTGPALQGLMGNRTTRSLVLGQTHGAPWRLSAPQARSVVQTLAESRGFDRTLDVAAAYGFTGGAEISARTTVAFGSRDLLLRSGARRPGQLPKGTLFRGLPGCGHLPMADSPESVADLIVESALDRIPTQRTPDDQEHTERLLGVTPLGRRHCDHGPTQNQSGKAMCTSPGAGAPEPVSTNDFMLIR